MDDCCVGGRDLSCGAILLPVGSACLCAAVDDRMSSDKIRGSVLEVVTVPVLALAAAQEEVGLVAVVPAPELAVARE